MTAPVLIGAAGVAMVFFLWRSRRSYLSLPELPLAGNGDPDGVTIVIPARDEEGKVGKAVRSFPGARVIVVNDGSSDRTAVEAAEAGAEVIDAPPPPNGWLGKPHACWVGAKSVTTEWVLFVDADTQYDPKFLGSALAYASSHSLDVLTVFLRQQRFSWAERVLLPYAFALYFCGVSARAVNRLGAGEALANGQCLLVRRKAYERMGGHERVAGSVIEDVAFAREAKRQGLRLHVTRGEQLGWVRMYDGLGPIWRGFQKNSFRFLAANPKGGLAVILASITLTSYLPALGVLLWKGWWAGAAAIAVLPSLLLAPWYGSLRQALAAPAAIYLFQAIALDGMFTALTGRKARWKDREV